MTHTLIESHDGLIIYVQTTLCGGHAEKDAALAMLVHSVKPAGSV